MQGFADVRGKLTTSDFLMKIIGIFNIEKTGISQKEKKGDLPKIKYRCHN